MGNKHEHLTMFYTNYTGFDPLLQFIWQKNKKTLTMSNIKHSRFFPCSPNILLESALTKFENDLDMPSYIIAYIWK